MSVQDFITILAKLEMQMSTSLEVQSSTSLELLIDLNPPRHRRTVDRKPNEGGNVGENKKLEKVQASGRTHAAQPRKQRDDKTHDREPARQSKTGFKRLEQGHARQAQQEQRVAQPAVTDEQVVHGIKHDLCAWFGQVLGQWVHDVAINQ